MGLTLEELSKRADRHSQRTRLGMKERYRLAKRLGFSVAEAVVLQNHKKETIIELALEKGLIKDVSDPKIGG